MASRCDKINHKHQGNVVDITKIHVDRGKIGVSNFHYNRNTARGVGD